jgi:hypothetical protein
VSRFVKNLCALTNLPALRDNNDRLKESQEVEQGSAERIFVSAEGLVYVMYSIAKDSEIRFNGCIVVCYKGVLYDWY